VIQLTTNKKGGKKVMADLFDAKQNIECLIEERTEVYLQETDAEKKEKAFNQIVKLQEVLNAINENDNAVNKTKIEADLKEKMNKLDNETKMAIAQIEANNRLAVAKMERNCKIFAASSEMVSEMARVGANVGMDKWKTDIYSAHLGDARRFDASGYSTINSTSSRMANTMAMKMLASKQY
jgi:hypothetical protein